MSDSEQGKPMSLGMPAHLAKQQLMENEDTQEMAKLFGVELEEYVDLVMEYTQNPEKVPQLHVIDDEEWHESGVDVPTSADIQKWFRGVASGEIDLTPEHEKINDRVSSGFEQEKLKEAAGLKSTIEAPRFEQMQRKVVVEKDNPLGSVLKDQLNAQRARVQMDPARMKNKKPKPKTSR